MPKYDGLSATDGIQTANSSFIEGPGDIYDLGFHFIQRSEPNPICINCYALICHRKTPKKDFSCYISASEVAVVDPPVLIPRHNR